MNSMVFRGREARFSEREVNTRKMDITSGSTSSTVTSAYGRGWNTPRRELVRAAPGVWSRIQSDRPRTMNQESCHGKARPGRRGQEDRKVEAGGRNPAGAMRSQPILRKDSRASGCRYKDKTEGLLPPSPKQSSLSLLTVSRRDRHHRRSAMPRCSRLRKPGK